MPTTIKAGSQVIVVEGAKIGEKGEVTRVFRHYDMGSASTHKLVSFVNEKLELVTTRLQFVREL